MNSGVQVAVNEIKNPTPAEVRMCVRWSVQACVRKKGRRGGDKTEEEDRVKFGGAGVVCVWCLKDR